MCCFQKEGREEEDIMTTPKQKGRKSDPEAKKKTPKKMPEDALKKRLNILYKTAYEYTVSRCGLRRGGGVLSSCICK